MAAVSWREFRRSTPKQRRFLDALTAQGDYSYLRDRTKRNEGSATPKVLYGGAGYGGKSYGLRTATMELNAQLAMEGFPGRWGCLLTSTYNQLSDRQLQHLHKEMGQFGRVKRSATRFLHFEFYDKALGGFYLRNTDDPSKYKGGQYDWILVDELTELSRRDFDDLDYALRGGDRLPFKAFGGATNPDGIGHLWCKKWWIEKDFTDDPFHIPEDFVFIQAMAYDNPTFDKTVEAKLRGHSDPMIVKARWEGSWDLNLGARFSTFNRNIHPFEWEELNAYYGAPGSMKTEELLRDEDLFALYASFDYGTSENSAASFHIHAIDHKQYVWTFLELYMQGYYLDDQARAIRPYMLDYPIVRAYCDPSLMGRDDQGISRLVKFRERGVRFVPGNNDRIEGWATFDTLLHYRRDESGVLLQAPRWRIHSSCRHLIRQLSSAPRSETKLEDVCPKFGDDHALDDCRYGLHSHFRGRTPPRQALVEHSPAWYRERRRRPQSDDLGRLLEDAGIKLES